MNGNKLKGNKPKKSGRCRKEVHADFDLGTDHYGKILNMEGGKSVSVQLLDSTDGKPVHVSIRGIHHKKVWFKKDDLVVVRGSELWGKVSDAEYNRVRRDFDKIDSKGDNNSIVFRDTNDLDDEEEDEVVVSGAKKIIPPQPTRNYDLSTLNKPPEPATKETINFDEI